MSGKPDCKYCRGHGYTFTFWGTHECDCVRERIYESLEKERLEREAKAAAMPDKNPTP